MKLIDWVRFTWNLEELPPLLAALPEHYHFDLVSRADEKELRAVIARSFAHDMSWGGAMHEINLLLDGWMKRAFAPEQSGICLALRHGLRMIGAAILIPEAEADNHFSPGPCVMMEYRNRGLGTALLAESLVRLRDSGLLFATGRARTNSPVAKFLYPKFNGIIAPDDTPLLAA